MRIAVALDRGPAPRWLALVPMSLRAEDGAGLDALDPPTRGAPIVDEAHLTEALLAAGDNMPQLREVLDYFADDPHMRVAARFLIANMPGKGYIVTELQDAKGTRIAFDPLAYPNFEASRDAIEALEKKHGTLEFKRDRKIEDLKTIDGRLPHQAHRAKRKGLEASSQRTSASASARSCTMSSPTAGARSRSTTGCEPLLRRYAGRAEKHLDGEEAR